MKFGQLIEYNMKNIFQKSRRKWDWETGRLVPDHLFLFFLKKALHKKKTSGLHLSFNIFQ